MYRYNENKKDLNRNFPTWEDKSTNKVQYKFMVIYIQWLFLVFDPALIKKHLGKIFRILEEGKD